ncbi:MAG TPA: lytic murein transglycosylase B, partial [Telluria sp.]
MKVLVPLLLALAVAGQAAPALASASHHTAKAKMSAAKSKAAAKAAAKVAAKAKAAKAEKAKVAAAPARPPIDYEGEDIHFGEWQAVREFEDDMIARHGFTRDELDVIIDRAR